MRHHTGAGGEVDAATEGEHSEALAHSGRMGDLVVKTDSSSGLS